MKCFVVLCTILAVLASTSSYASSQSSLYEHNGCIDEVLALKDFGTNVIEPFLHLRDGEEAFPQIQELVVFIRASIDRAATECAPYEDLRKAFIALHLLYSTYSHIAAGAMTEFEAYTPPFWRGFVGSGLRVYKTDFAEIAQFSQT